MFWTALAFGISIDFDRWILICVKTNNLIFQPKNETHFILLDVFFSMGSITFHLNVDFYFKYIKHFNIKQFFFRSNYAHSFRRLCAFISEFKWFLSRLPEPRCTSFTVWTRIWVHFDEAHTHSHLHIAVNWKIPMVVRVPRAHVIINLSGSENQSGWNSFDGLMLFFLFLFSYHHTFHSIQEAACLPNPMNSTWKLLSFHRVIKCVIFVSAFEYISWHECIIS